MEQGTWLPIYIDSRICQGLYCSDLWQLRRRVANTWSGWTTRPFEGGYTQSLDSPVSPNLSDSVEDSIAMMVEHVMCRVGTLGPFLWGKKR